MRQMFPSLLLAALLATPVASQAGSRNDAVIGSIIGGATGAVIGNNLGGRDGAIVGGAIGAAAGVAIATDNRRGYDNRYQSYQNYQGYQGYQGYQSHYDTGYGRYDRYDRDRYDRRYGDRRETVVVESPRYYYQGNDFVYGVPPRSERHDHGRHRGWDRAPQYGRYDRSGPEVVIIQQAPRYSRYQGEYCPPPRRR